MGEHRLGRALPQGLSFLLGDSVGTMHRGGHHQHLEASSGLGDVQHPDEEFRAGFAFGILCADGAGSCCRSCGCGTALLLQDAPGAVTHGCWDKQRRIGAGVSLLLPRRAPRAPVGG